MLRWYESFRQYWKRRERIYFIIKKIVKVIVTGMKEMKEINP